MNNNPTDHRLVGGGSSNGAVPHQNYPFSNFSWTSNNNNNSDYNYDNNQNNKNNDINQYQNELQRHLIQIKEQHLFRRASVASGEMDPSRKLSTSFLPLPSQRRKSTAFEDLRIEKPEILDPELTREEFSRDLIEFCEKSGDELKVPKFKNLTIDLYDLFVAVMRAGGFEYVSASRKWTEVLESMGIHQRSYAGNFLRSYQRTLYPYEMALRIDRATGGTGEFASRAVVLENGEKKKKSRGSRRKSSVDPSMIPVDNSSSTQTISSTSSTSCGGSSSSTTTIATAKTRAKRKSSVKAPPLPPAMRTNLNQSYGGYWVDKIQTIAVGTHVPVGREIIGRDERGAGEFCIERTIRALASTLDVEITYALNSLAVLTTDKDFLWGLSSFGKLVEQVAVLGMEYLGEWVKVYAKRHGVATTTMNGESSKRAVEYLSYAFKPYPSTFDDRETILRERLLCIIKILINWSICPSPKKASLKRDIKYQFGSPSSIAMKESRFGDKENPLTLARCVKVVEFLGLVYDLRVLSKSNNDEDDDDDDEEESLFSPQSNLYQDGVDIEFIHLMRHCGLKLLNSIGPYIAKPPSWEYSRRMMLFVVGLLQDSDCFEKKDGGSKDTLVGDIMLSDQDEWKRLAIETLALITLENRMKDYVFMALSDSDWELVCDAIFDVLIRNSVRWRNQTAEMTLPSRASAIYVPSNPTGTMVTIPDFTTHDNLVIHFGLISLCNIISLPIVQLTIVSHKEFINYLLCFCRKESFINAATSLRPNRNSIIPSSLPANPNDSSPLTLLSSYATLSLELLRDCCSNPRACDILKSSPTRVEERLVALLVNEKGANGAVNTLMNFGSEVYALCADVVYALVLRDK